MQIYSWTLQSCWCKHTQHKGWNACINVWGFLVHTANKPDVADGHFFRYTLVLKHMHTHTGCTFIIMHNPVYVNFEIV